MALIPVTVSPFGHIGGLFKKFLYGTDCLPCPDCYNKHPDGSKTRRINAEAAYKLAASTKVPFGILNQANAIWRAEHPSLSYSGTYHATDPKTWFEHELGLLSCDVISSHLLRAHGHNRSKRTRPNTADNIRPVVQRVETANRTA